MASASWTLPQLNESLQRREIYPLYLFYGDENFLIDEAVENVIVAALGDGLRDFNLNTFYAEDCDVEAVRDAVETLPMMAPLRVVVIKGVEGWKDKQWDAVLPLLERPVETTALVLTASKVDKRKKNVKLFHECGVALEFKRPYDNQIPDWVARLAQRQGLRLDSDVIHLLHQLVGSNLSELNSELSKLKEYVGARNQISNDDVLAVVSRVRVDSVFELTDAIGSNDRSRALICLANLLDHGQNEVGILSLITRHIRLLKQVKAGLDDGLSGAKLSTRVGVSSYFLKQYVEQAYRWNQDKIERAFAALLDTDRALKSSPVAAPLWLESFILHTCVPQDQA